MNAAQDDFFVSGKPYFHVSGAVIGAAGVAVIIAGGLAAHNSGGYYIGGIYSGILSVFFAYSVLQVDVYKSFLSLFLWTAVNLIVCVVALALSSADQAFVNTLEAWNSDYYSQAYACELTYANDNDGTIEDNQCSCITSESSDTCYNYNHIPSCSALLDLVPGQVGAAVAFLTILLIAYLLVLALVLLNRCRPEVVRTRAEREELAATLPPVPVTVTATATVTSPIIVVQANKV